MGCKYATIDVEWVRFVERIGVITKWRHDRIGIIVVKGRSVSVAVVVGVGVVACPPMTHFGRAFSSSNDSHLLGLLAFVATLAALVCGVSITLLLLLFLVGDFLLLQVKLVVAGAASRALDLKSRSHCVLVYCG